MTLLRTMMCVLALLAAAGAASAQTTYELRVDGLACPYCAYGIEKAFMQTEGVEAVDIDFDRGVVLVRTAEGTRLRKAQAEQVVEDAGFTLRDIRIVSEGGER